MANKYRVQRKNKEKYTFEYEILIYKYDIMIVYIETKRYKGSSIDCILE